jgi:hypothetical protein
MRVLVCAVVVLLIGTATACGSGVGIERSELSRSVPPVTAPGLQHALPQAPDLGPGWTLSLDQIDDTDYFLEHAKKEIVAGCEGSYPHEASSLGGSAHARTATLISKSPPVWASVHIAVDSAGGSADRLAWIRAAYRECDEVEYENDSGRFRESYTFLDRPDVRADESFAVRVTAEPLDAGPDGQKGNTLVDVVAYARAGGLVVALEANEKPDVLPALPKVMERARTSLNI